ncbi:ImmA/IrrE family metallo-endopeptidase [Dellaglioa carnosa]|uniref:ImmA/IrrE family metallo-endopeptidase n=1 Tax=Dellaglioa carnosa TaxID=2995136 RepID=A0ABT4JKE7_9LACO|nr:ImmA/IrrE family metallo-endopeptidase [Dellaglioa carnosa]MCZ2490832.1 ImmA/IrrE family metallo-endopeptidase [Dellaglioa carnosa]MCZ2493910.1 ImmA/IrrE family metallo-endopeptidase [Dellaglioa carnosa]MDK1730774.1 ImmA/IrrE family metallo-endopeptidase [Dellaglioa carnosa]
MSMYLEIKDNLLSIAAKNNITVIENEMLTADNPDIAVINNRGILMNVNASTDVSYLYRMAHELSHILYGDSDSQTAYQFSPYSRKKEEINAHRNAIKLLMSIQMPTNPNTFMEYYNVPEWLLYDVAREFNDQLED